MVESTNIKSKTQITEWGPDSGGRQKGVLTIKPIVYGNISKYIGNTNREDKHTHQWTVYVKPYKNEDMSYVKKVQFKLHESYANPQRVKTIPPFEIHETGWGEFEMVIKIYFVDPNERPVTIYHQLKLFNLDPESNKPLISDFVVSEHYDEIIFQDPSLMMTQILDASTKPILPQHLFRHETNFKDKEISTLEAIIASKKKVRLEIVHLKERLRKAIELKANVQDQIDKLTVASS